ncbi:MAG: SMC family ATPase [Lachnospiraceae bacterium]|nr:SMC family ATPase [Lachnospiraceae bacterium]
MKPIYIKMQAFGSYQEECISFEKVDHGLFLITGDTGAGKTTIFDAITFALYGKTSGGKRDGKMMRSQYAPADMKTKVEYKFYYCGNEYTIIRSPEQLNWKKMTDEDGKEYYKQLSTPLQSKVELIMPDGSSFSGTSTKINHKIEEIIGLNVKQFTQIAMLAQGDFIKLLHASSEERKEIFAKIFDTKIYEAIEQETAKRAKAANIELAENKANIARELERVKCIENSRYDEEWNSEKYQKRFSETGKEAFLALVLDICKEAEEKWNQTETERKETNTKISSLDKDILYARSTNKLFEELNQWEEKKLLLEKRSQEIEQLKQKIQMGERALEVERDYNELEQRKKEAGQCRQRAKNLEQWISENQKQAEKLKNEAQQAGNKYDSEAPQLYADEEAIGKSLNKYDELEEIIEKQKDTKEKLKQFACQAENLVKDKENCEEKLKKLSENTKELKEKTRNPEVLENEIKIIEARQKDIEEIIKNISVLEKTKTELKKKEEYYQKAAEKESAKQKEYEQLYHGFINSQAAALRAELREGTPCPVCGSIYHNCEAAGEINEEKGSIDDKKLKKEKEAYDKTVQEKETAYRDMLDKTGEKNSVIHVLYAGCKKFYNISENRDFFETKFEDEWKQRITEDNKSILQELNENKKLQKETIKNHKIIKENEKTIEVLIQTAENIKKTIEQRNSEINRLKMEESTYDTKVEVLKQQLVYADKSSAIKEQKKKQQELKKLKEAADNTKKAFLEFEEEMHKKIGELVSEQENMKRFDAKLQEANTCYKESLKKQSFESTEAFWAALIKREEIEKLRKKITDYKTELAVADDNQKRLIKETKGKEKSDITYYEREKSELEKYSKVLDKAVKLLFNLVSVNKEAYKKACLLYEQREKMRQKAVILKGLDDTVNGRLSGKHINFQTYIQRRYFKQVIDRANKRLYVMSGNQFLLQCRDVENLGAQGYVGLDLDVYSIVNDQTRDVKTLSGGESFMAALSMALGMADIIQNSRGSIHIDTMFIDEGFGSLSEETRNQAVNILNELSEGKRLVGIISHVSELKSQVETKLVVKKNDKGSSIVWEI